MTSSRDRDHQNRQTDAIETIASELQQIRVLLERHCEACEVEPCDPQEDTQRCLDAINSSLDERPITPDELPHFAQALKVPPSTIVAPAANQRQPE